MGHKKRKSAPRSKQPPEPAASPVAGGPVQAGAEHGPAPIAIKTDAVAESDSSSHSSVKLECERALTALRRGNHTKALRLMKELCSRHENSPHAALIHRVQGTVCIKVASIIDDVNAKQRHLKNAVESAQRAVELSSNSVEFAHFYANLLFDVANEAKEFEQVVAECERALAIESPVDPAKESLQEESQPKLKTAEARINHVQGELRNLIQKCNSTSTSTRMKNSGGYEKFTLVPTSQATEDPMELDLVQARRPDEIKKATKTLEERRKEVEVRVAAARLLQQQKSEKAGSQNDGRDKGLDLSGSGPRASNDRRKHGKKILSPTERKDMVVRSYWSSLSNEEKKQWLSIRVSDLNAHFGFLKEVLASEVITEAVENAKAFQSWYFWVCSRCGNRFSDDVYHVQHVMHSHLGYIATDVWSTFPQDVDEKWAKMLCSCIWKPIDASAALEMLENQKKHRNSNRAGSFSSGQKTEDFEDSVRDAWYSSAEKDDKWPLCDDPERAKLLDKIHTLFEALIEEECLSKSHLGKVLQFTEEELQGLTSGSQLLSQVVNHSPVGICFLGASQLKKILKFLQEVARSCLGRDHEKNTGPMHDRDITYQCEEIKEIIILSEDASCIILDETSLPTERTCSPMNESTAYDVAGPISSKDVSDNDAFLAWMYSGLSSVTETLESWAHRKKEKAEEHSGTFQMLEKELLSIQTLCTRKNELIGYKEALHALEELCIEKGMRIQNGDEIVLRSYKAILRKRMEDLKGDESNDYHSSGRYESEAVKNILREAGSLGANQFGDEDGQEEEYFHQMNGCIEVTMQKQREEFSLEICKVDARINRSVQNLHDLQSKIDARTALDYRWILLPLIKSYMRTHLEDLADKDAIKKSDAAREAFLAELALDSSKVVRDRNDKKRQKEHRKTKASKVSGISEQHRHSPEKNEPDSSTVLSDDDRPDSEIHSSIYANELKEQEEELRRRMELEAEERKLEEILEYQRRIENEGRRIAEQQKKLTQTQLGNGSEGFSDVMKEPLADGHDKMEQLKLSTKGSGNSHDVSPVARGSLISLDTQKTGSADHAEVKQGMSDGGLPQDATISFDQQTRRRGKQQKSSTKLMQGKSQVRSPSGKENAGAGCLEGTAHDNTHQYDTFQAYQQMPSPTYAEPGTPGDANDAGFTPIEPASAMTDVSDVLGAGLQNEVGEYNCFLNVIIQSLWHLRCFHDEFLERSTSDHVHVGDPCVICALYEIFHALTLATADSQREAVAPTSLRIALSNLYPDSNFFQKGQMNDASEVLGVIFDCLHQSFIRPSGVSDNESVESNTLAALDCTDSKACLVHSLFGMNIFERMNCSSCGLESRLLKYTSFFHNINANALRTTKSMSAESSFDYLLGLVERNHQLACDPDSDGCGKLNQIYHFLSNPPTIFITVLGWQKTNESADDIAATLAALSTEVDLSVLYCGLDPKHIHSLVSMVCYYGQHYRCFSYSHEHEQWIMYDDTNVQVIGSWADVLTMCKEGCMQPQLLFFEAVK